MASKFSGLQAVNANSYLNALVQTLYMTLDFRQEVYNWEYVPEVHGEE